VLCQQNYILINENTKRRAYMEIKGCGRGMVGLIREDMRTPQSKPYLSIETTKPMAQLLLKRLARFARALFISLFVFVVCGSCEAAPLKRVTVAYASLGTQMTGVWMAKEMGAFERHGVHADLLYISSGPVVVSALLGGDLHAGVAATNAVIAAVFGGAPLVSTVSTANRPVDMSLWVQPEITRPEDLRGKTLGVTRFGGVTDNLTRLMLRKYGLDGAVNVRQLGGTIEVGAAFQQRVIAGAVTSGVRVDAHVPVRMLMNMGELGIPYSMNLMVFSRDFYRRNLETVDGIVRGYIEGVAALHHQKERALRVISKYSRLSDPKKAEDLYLGSIVALERIPLVEPEAVLSILEFMGKKRVALETFVDNSIMERLIREGFTDKLYGKGRF
jgi:NitT/TauT family transport system substrate-binding protein